VDHPAARNRYQATGGPEPLTWRDVVATYERVLGRPISVRFVAIGEPVPLPDPMPSIMAGMEAYDSAVEMEEIARTLGAPLTRLETFVREQCYSQPAKETRHRRTSEDFVSAGYGG
jgi:hypothetical protein